jgi:hypothetical protein
VPLSIRVQYIMAEWCTNLRLSLSRGTGRWTNHKYRSRMIENSGLFARSQMVRVRLPDGSNSQRCGGLLRRDS